MKQFAEKQIEIAQAKAKYDEHVKNVLAIKPLLARILKETVSEVRDYPPEEIEKMIEGDPEIGSIPVDPGMTNHPRITGNANEDKVPFEGEVRYDILTYILVPGKENKVKILINVEGQRNSDPGYDLVTRGIYYGARRISAQKGTEFIGSNYDDLKKVCSIWVCFDAPERERNTITEYHVTKRDLVGKMPDVERYDLLSVVFIRLGGDISEYPPGSLQQLLMTIFSGVISFEEKKKAIQEYGIEMSDKEEVEVNLMCNLSDLVEERGIQKGREQGFELGHNQGFELGRNQGFELGRFDAIRRLSTKLSEEEIMSFGYTEEEIRKAKEA